MEVDFNSKGITDETLIGYFDNIDPMSVKNLSLMNNQISDISFLSKFVNLKFLYLGKNNIVDISPLKNLVKLKQLDLSNNQIVDISPLSILLNIDFLRL